MYPQINLINTGSIQDARCQHLTVLVVNLIHRPLFNFLFGLQELLYSITELL